MSSTRPNQAYLDNETEEQRAERLARGLSQPAPQDGDQIIVGEYSRRGVRVTREMIFRVSRGVPVVLDRGEFIPMPVFIGRHSGEWEVVPRR